MHRHAQVGRGRIESVDQVRDDLRYSSPQTTRRYAHSEDKARAEAMAKAFTGRRRER